MKNFLARFALALALIVAPSAAYATNWTGTFTITTAASGTLTGATATTATNSGAAFTASTLINFCIRITSGTGANAACNVITANTTTGVTVSSFAGGTPSAGSGYEIVLRFLDQDHVTGNLVESTNIITEIANNAQILVDGAFSIRLGNTCGTGGIRWNFSTSTIPEIVGNNRTVTGKAGFWSGLITDAVLTCTPNVSYLRMKDTIGPNFNIGTGLNTATTIHHIWFDDITTQTIKYTGTPTASLTATNYFVTNSVVASIKPVGAGTFPQKFDTFWVDHTQTNNFAVLGGSGNIEWLNNSVLIDGASGLTATPIQASGVTLTLNYIATTTNTTCFLAYTATASGPTIVAQNEIGQGCFYSQVTGSTESFTSIANDYLNNKRSVASTVPFIFSAAPGGATSESDYIAGQAGAAVDNVDTTASGTSSTASPQQYLNLTTTRFTALASRNLPLTTTTPVVSAVTASGATITYDSGTGVVSDQQTHVNSTSVSGQMVLSVPSTSQWQVGMTVEIGYGTARYETCQIAVLNPATSIVCSSNLLFTHTTAQNDLVSTLLRNPILPYVQCGTSSGVYTISSPLPNVKDYGLLFTGLKTAINGVNFTWIRVGNVVTFSNLAPSTTYFCTAYGVTPIDELESGSEFSFTTSGAAGSTRAYAF